MRMMLKFTIPVEKENEDVILCHPSLQKAANALVPAALPTRSRIRQNRQRDPDDFPS